VAARPRSAPARPGWHLALGVVLAVAAGCGADDGPPQRPEIHATPTGTASDPAAVYCQRHIDQLIAADIVPRADRDYAMAMCGAEQRK
jgi:hypothetical protein